MKKILTYFSAALITLTACEKEKENITAVPEEADGTTFSITATFDDNTKAGVAVPDDRNECKTTWDAGDRIAVHTKHGHLAILSTEASGATVTFTGIVPDGDSIEDGAVAYYPASSAIEGNAWQITMPDSYPTTADAAKGIVLMGTVDAGSLSASFSHLGALLVFQVKEIPPAATEMTFTAKGCCGTYSVVDGKIVNGPSGASVTIGISDIDKAYADIAIPLPTGTYNGFTLSFNDGESAPKTTAKTFTLNRRQYAVMQEFTVSGDDSEYGVTGGFQDWNPATRAIMSKVPGYDSWYVARGISIAGGTGDDDGFKICSGDSWSDTSYGGASDGTSPLYTYIAKGSKNIKIDADGTYDIYFNATEGNEKILVLGSGDPIVKTVYVLLEYVPGTNFGSNPCLHIWGADKQGDVTNWESGDFVMQEGTTVIDGIQFRTFPVKILENKTNFWKGGHYRLQYYLTPKGSRLFELREDKASENRGTHNLTNNVTDVSFFVRAGLYADGIESFTQADAIPSLINISGTFNGWPDSVMGLQGIWKGNGILWKNVAIPEGEAGWKFRNYPKWGYQNICTSSNEAVILSEEYELILGGSNNIKINIPEDGNYDFFLDMTTLKVLVTKSDDINYDNHHEKNKLSYSRVRGNLRLRRDEHYVIYRFP